MFISKKWLWKIIFSPALDRMVYIRSYEDTLKKIPGAQTFVLTKSDGSKEGVEISARSEDGLDKDKRGAS